MNVLLGLIIVFFFKSFFSFHFLEMIPRITIQWPTVVVIILLLTLIAECQHVYWVGGANEIVVSKDSCYLINLFYAGTCVWVGGMLYT